MLLHRAVACHTVVVIVQVDLRQRRNPLNGISITDSLFDTRQHTKSHQHALDTATCRQMRTTWEHKLGGSSARQRVRLFHFSAVELCMLMTTRTRRINRLISLENEDGLLHCEYGSCFELVLLSR